MLRHKNFRKLSGSSVKVLLELCSRHNGYNNRKIVCSYEELANPLGLGKATVSNALKQLKAAGFIVCTKKGYFTGRQASVWEITFLPSEGYEPTHLWKDPAQRPCRSHLAPIKLDLIQEVQVMQEEENKNQVLIPNAKALDGS